MERRDNYAIAAAQARELFLNYDQQKLALKLHTILEEDYLNTVFFGEPYRIHRRTGDISRFHDGQWVDANSFSESLTLLDLVCDSAPDRHLSYRYKNLRDFGLQFHTSLLENPRDPLAEAFDANPNAFRAACEALGGKPFPTGDISYTFDVFEGLTILLKFWFGDEDFPPAIHWLWDENATMYLKYETMHYALGLLQSRIKARMNI